MTVTRLGRGLPFNIVYDIAQDKTGFLWLATEHGLYRYDGYTFVESRKLFNDSITPNAAIRQLVIDSWDNIWMNADGLYRINLLEKSVRQLHVENDSNIRRGNFTLHLDRSSTVWIRSTTMYKFDRQQERFLHYALSLQDASMEKGFVESSTEQGVFWIASRDGRFYRIESVTGRTREFTIPNKQLTTSNTNQIHSLFQDSQGNLWIGSEAHAYVFDSKKELFIEIMKGEPFNSFGEDAKKQLYIGSSSRLYKLDLTTFRRDEPKSVTPVYVTEARSLIRDILFDGTGNLFLHAKGVYRYNAENSTLRFYQYEPGNNRSLSVNTLRMLFQDRSGVIWVGTDGGGLCKIERRGKKFALYSSAVDSSTTENFNVRAIGEANDGTVWIGSFDGLHFLKPGVGLKRFHFEHQLANNINSEGKILIGSIYTENDGSVWLGSWGAEGVFMFQSNVDKVNRVTFPENKKNLLPGVRRFFRDSYGSLWIATGNGAFRIKQDGADHFLPDSDNANSISFHTVFCFGEDSDGMIWIGTLRGLNRYEPSTNSFTLYFNDPSQPKSLSKNDIRVIHRDKTGTLWVGTAGGGLNKYESATDNFTRFTMNEGLPDNRIYGILEDDHGNLWISTHNGLCKFNTHTYQCRNYSESDGLQASEFNTGAYFKNKNGVMYFGGASGFNVFHPDSIQDNSFVPPVVITRLKIFDEEIPFENSGIELSYFQNYISLEYSALSYLLGEENKYAYFMEGFDRNWHEVGTNRSANYSHLDPGEYTFKVIASNSDGVWNTQGASLRIIIIPPFWMTTWFRVIAIVLFLSIGPIIYYRRVTTLKKEKALQEDFSRQLLDNVEGERKRIAGEIHDSLGQNLLVVKNVLQTGLESAENVEKTKGTIENAVNIVGQTIQDARTLSYTLHPLMLEELGLTTALQYLLRKTCETFSIQFTSNVEDIDGLFSPEAEVHIFRVVQECLNNVVKHSGATTATLTVKRHKEFVELLLSDNGKGFDATKSGVHRGNVGGFGQKNMKERTRLLGAEMNVVSIMSGGTTVSLRCPVKEAAQNG